MKRIGHFILFVALSFAVKAEVSVFSPIKQNALLEHQLERLMVMAGKAHLKKPYSSMAIKQAYKAVCIQQSVPAYCSTVNTWLKQTQEGLLSVKAQHILANNQVAPLPNSRGKGASTDASVHVSYATTVNSYFAYSLGMAAWHEDSGSDWVADNSYLSLGTDWAQLDLGYRPHWWSPFEDSAMMISTHAQTMATVTVSNTLPWSALNINYELFIGELSESHKIAYNKEYISGKPLLTGIHLGMEPFNGVAFGLNRIMQSGGGERGLSSFSDFWNAFFDPNAADNTQENLSFDEQFGNQIASVTMSMNFGENKDYQIYMEYAGEDTSDANSFKLGNTATSLGVFVPNIFNDIDARVEWTEWQNAWYVHSVYQDGLTNHNFPIGHWPTHYHPKGTGQGGSNLYMNLSWQQQDDFWQIKARYIQFEDYGYELTSEQHFEVQTIYHTTINQWPVFVDVSLGKNNQESSFYRVSYGVNF